jgi:hypothetical protein
MESRFAVLYQPASEPGPDLPGIIAAMRRFSEAVKGRVYFFRSSKSTDEILADLKAELEPGASVIVIRADEAAYFGKAPFVTAVSQEEPKP